MAMNKRKTTTAIVAGVTAAVLLLGGTFAWTSISQQAKNEAIVDINPGGRLHDDFNGTNKDVYVENFSSGATGVDIFARIRLDQYFEVGQDAGLNKDSQDARNVKVEVGGVVYDEGTWVTYKPVDEEGTPLETLSNPVQANGNWTWDLGNGEDNKPYYMPTFNMNKDSLAADINGTYEGTTNGDIVHYDDYKQYGADSTATGTEVYDWDDEDADEETSPDITYDETDPRDSADVYHKEGQTHTAEQISTTATIYTMAEWLALPDEDKIGNFWVYDEDGWAYWAQAIAPETTTGLLLDSITMSRVPDDNYYYGINVVGQFATASDWTMLYAPADQGGGESMTDGAKQLMELITATNSSTEDDNTPEDPEDDGVLTLDGGNSDTVWTTHNVQIPVEFVTDGLDTEAEGYVEPDISEIVVYIEGDNPDSTDDDTPLEKDTQYTYEYDAESGTGTLTITDTTLDGYIHVTDKNGVVEGDVNVTSDDNTDDITNDGTLTLRSDNADTESAYLNTELPVEFDASDIATDATQPDISDVTVTYDVYNEETDSYDTVTLDKDTQYTYEYDADSETGSLTITDETLVGERLNVKDKNNVVMGDVDVTEYVETQTAVITIEGWNEPNAEGYIYLDAVTTQVNEYTVYVDDSFDLATLTATEATGVTFTPDVANKTAALTISPFAWDKITITATDTSGATETVYVVPLFDVIKVTPDMDGTVLTLRPGPYGLVAEEFAEGTYVVFSIEAIGDDPITRCLIMENAGTSTLSVATAETAPSFYLVATQGDTVVKITLNLVNTEPSLAPNFGYIDNDELVGWGIEEGENVISLKVGHNYGLSTGVPLTFDGTVAWSVEETAPAYFGDGSNTALKQSEAVDPKSGPVAFHIAENAEVGTSFVLTATLTDALDGMGSQFSVMVNIVAVDATIE